jgi:hypothetical protein
MGPEVLLVMQVASAAVGIVGALTGGQSQQQGYEAQADVSTYNAQVSENAAATARLTAAENAKRQRKVMAMRMGTLRNTGGAYTSMDLLEATYAQEELAVMDLLHAGEMEAQAHEQQAVLDKHQSQLRRSQGKSASTAGKFSAAGSLLSTAPKVSTAYNSLGAGSPLKVV